DVGKDEPRGAVDAFSKQAVDDHPGEQDDGELYPALLATHTPARLEHHGENEGVDGEHEQGIEERPRQAHNGASVAADHFALGHLPDESAVTSETAKNFQWRCRVLLMRIHFA